MSVIKSQIHDGFATIRTRGLHRSRSRAEQLEKLKPISTKSDSVPLYENNNDLLYNPRTPPHDLKELCIQNEINEFDRHFMNLSPTCNSFKLDYIEPSALSTNFSTPSSSYETHSNGFHTPKSPDSLQNENFLYTRPESPYGRIGRKANSQESVDLYQSSPKLFSPTYYRKDVDTCDYALLKVASKPPIKSNTSYYRKSYSHPSHTIYEDSTLPAKFNKPPADRYYNSSNYYNPSEISDSTGSHRSAVEELDGLSLEQNHRLNNFERRYATLSYPKEAQRLKQAKVNESNRSDIEYLDPLDCKIGCQTTLRSKPKIPWYELAIRKNNRRQSCPPIEAHVVAAFEQSLTNMTQRLQQLSATADRKDGELTEMRQTIELLRKQSIQAGLTSAHMHSMNEQPIRPAETIPAQPPPTSTENAPPSTGTIAMQRHLSSDSMCSLNSVSSGCSAQDKKKKKGWLRSSFTKAFSRNAKISKTNRHHSTASNLDHLSSANSSGLDTSALPPPSPSRSPLKMVTVVENAKPADAVDLDGNPIVEDLKKQLREKDLVLTDIRLEALSSASQLESLKDTVSKMRQEMMNLKQNNERLQKLVTSRSLAGSEVSLGGPISPSGSMGEPRRYSLADGNLRPPLELPKSLEETEEENIPPAPAPEPPPLIQSPSTHSELTPPPTLDHMPAADHISTPADDIADHTDGKKIAISVYLAQPESFAKYAEEVHESDEYYANDGQDDEFDSKIKSLNGSNRNEFVIAYTYISGKTTWQNLDYIVRKTFKDYVARIDPGTNLGLNTDSITSYHLGEAKRGPEMGFPELLPCGYIVGNVKSLYICLQGVGSLAFDSLIPRSIVHRYISLLTEHRRLILCGPSGTGKSYLARKLAEFLVARSQRGNPSEAIATFNVDHKSSKELRQYLGHIAEQASMSNGASELPSVIILDNLHHASALGDVFQVLLSAGPAAKLPCIIGTMSQATCNTTNLQLHHNFRWVLTANHMEPVKGFLARFLRRRLYSLELSTHNVQPQLAAVLAWLPTVWQHINRFLETHSSSDVTIGPRLFLSCPLDLIDSQVWFTDIWNYHLEPYLVEAVREGVQLYGRRVGAWVDPSTYIRETYPWTTSGSGSIPPLRLINAEDVGLEGGVTGNLDSQDPLLNMLMRLQEAANYSGNQEQESDCASLDSNITQDSSAGAE